MLDLNDELDARSGDFLAVLCLLVDAASFERV